MKNFNDVSTPAVTGGLWHAQSVSGTFAAPSMRNLGYDALRLVSVRNARLGTPAVAITATAKQAPQSRRSSAHP